MKLRLRQVLMSALLGVGACVALQGWGAYRAERSLRWAHSTQLAPALCLSRLDATLKNARAHINAGYSHDPAQPASRLHQHPITLHTGSVRHGAQEARRLWRAYRSAPHGADAEALIEQVDRGVDAFIEQALLPSADALDAARYDDAAAAVTRSYLDYQATEIALAQLQQQTDARVQAALLGLKDEQARMRLFGGGLALSALGLAVWGRPR
jgi:Tar ligand binding domain homologue